MKFKTQLLAWLVLPVIFFCCATGLRSARGPWFLSPAYDPHYAYLLNGLNLALWLPPGHTDHPGTPLQLALAGYIRAKNMGVDKGRTALNVINGMEAYLLSLNRLLLVAYALALVFAGWAVTRLTGDSRCGFLTQASPFLLGGNFQYFTRVSPEPVLLLLSLLLVVGLICLAQPRFMANWRWIALFGFALGTAIAIKVTALPLFFLGLLLIPDWKNRARLAVVVALAVIVWTLPIYQQYGRVAGWLWSLVTKQGVYGSGEAGVVKSANFLAGLAKLLMENPVFALTLLASATGLWLRREERRQPSNVDESHPRWWWLLAALSGAQIIQWIVSAKNPQSRYLAPAQGLVALNWIALRFLFVSRTDSLAVSMQRGMRAVLVAALLLSPVTLWQLSAQMSRERAAKLELAAFVRKQDAPTIFHYGASSLPFALAWASSFAGNAYHDLLNQIMHPEQQGMYFLNHWQGETFTLEKKVDVREILDGKTRVFLQGDELKPVELRFLPADYVAEPRAKVGDEVLYEIHRRQAGQ